MSNKKKLKDIPVLSSSTELKKYNPERTKEIVFKMMTVGGEKKDLLKKIGEKILPEYLNGTPKEREIILKEFKEKSLELLRILESESHVSLMESFTPNYRMLAQEMTSQLIEEYQCANEAEKALAEIITNAYVRVLDNSRRLNNELECRDITPNRNTYILMLSKQVDRANRQFLSALLTLKQFKAPIIEMNVKATNAFVSQNQQINIPHNEIIEPQ